MSKTTIFQQLQHQLTKRSYLVADTSKRSRTMIIMPGFSLDPAELAKLKGAEYYEQRMLYTMGYLRDANTTVVFVSSRQIDPAIIEYYIALFSRTPSERASMLQRWHQVYVGNAKTHRTLTQKILHSRRLREQILHHVADRSAAVIRCFNVSVDEQALAVKLGIPLFAPDPQLLVHGSKSGSRELFRAAKLTLPYGVEHIYSTTQLITAINHIKHHQRGVAQVVVKLNHSFSGVGNAVVDVTHWPKTRQEAYLRRMIEPNDTTETASSYFAKLHHYGGIAEEWLAGEQVLSPSTQMVIMPDGKVNVVSTHEQLFDAKTKQIYLGASFPAATDVRLEIMQQAKRVGVQLSKLGIIGPFGVDFVAVKQRQRWQVFPVEINLRKGGTTHPLRIAQRLTESILASDGLLYDAAQRPVYYFAYDNIVSERYKKISPEELIQLVRSSGLEFDAKDHTGITLHLLGTLYKYGKFGAVCIGRTPKAAEQLFLVLQRAVDEYAEHRLHAQQIATDLVQVNQARLVKTFIQLARIASPSQQEAAVTEQVREWLVQAGAKVRVDQRGNLIAKLDGSVGAMNEPMLLSAHLDTVAPGENIHPVIRGKTIMSSGDTILGADDKLGVAYIIELLRLIQEHDLPHRPLEIVLSVCEEQFAQGVAALDYSKLHSAVAYVLDGAEIGEIDILCPYVADVNVKIIGKEAHSGVAPEQGIHAIKIAAQAIAAMKLGKVDAETTANIGVIQGGSNRNVVPGKVELVGEVRGFSKQRLEEQLERMHKALYDACEDYGGLLSYDSKLVLEGYILSKTDSDLKQLMQFMKQCGILPRLRRTYGGSDANVFVSHGIKAFDLGIGVRYPHTNEERVDIPDMVKSVELLMVLVRS